MTLSKMLQPDEYRICQHCGRRYLGKPMTKYCLGCRDKVHQLGRRRKHAVT